MNTDGSDPRRGLGEIPSINVLPRPLIRLATNSGFSSRPRQKRLRLTNAFCRLVVQSIRGARFVQQSVSYDKDSGLKCPISF